MNKLNKVVIITGSSSGIGLSTAKFLSSKGFKVYGISRTKTNENFIQYECDVTNTTRMKEIFEEIYNREGRIDYLINNAGIGISGAIELTPDEKIEKIFNINVIAPIKLCREIIPYMRKNNFGRIINISSVAAVTPLPFQACYSATKASIQNFSLALNNEVKNFNIKVSAVLPGDTKTGFTNARIKNEINEDENYKNRIVKSVSKMEKDEQKGGSPLKVSKTIYKTLKRKNPPLIKTVGFKYKLVVFLIKILPTRFANFVLKKMYG